jgi:hypothetical protein
VDTIETSSDPSANNGNEIWWNDGDGSGQIGMGSYWGSYLTASSTFFDASVPNQAQYGIFVSNAKGPARSRIPTPARLGFLHWGLRQLQGHAAIRALNR